MGTVTIQRHVALFGVASMVSLTACATPGPSNATTMIDDAATRSNTGLTRVTVENRNPQDVRVYLVRGSTRIHLGPVGSLESRTFELPGSMIGGRGFLQLEVLTLASRQRYATDPIPIGRGKNLQWQIESNLALSSILLR